MSRRFRRSWFAWCLVVAWLLPSLAPLSADGPPRRKKGARKGRASGDGAKGDFVMGIVPTNQSPVAAASVPRQGNILAVVIGVGKFQHTGIKPLRYPAKDAADFAAWLRSVGVPPQNIALLTDKKATFKAVNQTLVQWLRKRSTSRFDSVILFFSGHGVKDEQLYWLMHDTELENLDATALRRSLLQKNLNRVRVKNKLLFVDACYSRATSTSPGGTDMVAQKNQLLPGEAIRGLGGQGSFSLFSSDGDQESLEPASLGNGLFTYWLLRGLKGEADASKDGILTATELYAFVANNVRRASSSYGKPQDPAQEDKTVGGQLALLRFPSAASAAPTTLAEASPSGVASLRIEGTPLGATLYLDGDNVGQTPWVKSLPPGRLTLEIRKDGYASKTEKLRLWPHDRRTLTYRLQALGTPAPRRESLAVVPARRKPPKADVAPPPRREELPFSLTQNQVARVIQRGTSKINSCKEKHGGGVLSATASWTIQRNGRASKISVTPGSPGSFASCVKSAIGGWRFPAFSGEPLDISDVPFSFD